MELPPYRLPTWKTTLTHMWDKCAQYLKKMGGMILIASVIVWFLSYYPRTDATAGTETHYANSYLGRLGKGCEPVFSPLGFNWKASVALLSGLPAKEIVVSTLGVLYSEGAVTTPAEGEIIGGADGTTEIVVAESAAKEPSEPAGDEETASLSQRLLASGDFSTASALAFLVFILLYVPCIATVVAIGSEAGWKWAAASVVYNTGDGLVSSMDRLPHRPVILNDGLAGLYRGGYRDRRGGGSGPAAVEACVRETPGRLCVVRLGTMSAEKAQPKELNLIFAAANQKRTWSDFSTSCFSGSSAMR